MVVIVGEHLWRAVTKVADLVSCGRETFRQSGCP
jgi:hypothetical protein